MKIKQPDRPRCDSRNGDGAPCQRPAKNGDVYCKIHRRCECCNSRCPAMARLCRKCQNEGCRLPPGPPPNPGEAAIARAKARTEALKRGDPDRREYGQRKVQPERRPATFTERPAPSRQP